MESRIIAQLIINVVETKTSETSMKLWVNSFFKAVKLDESNTLCKSTMLDFKTQFLVESFNGFFCRWKLSRSTFTWKLHSSLILVPSPKSSKETFKMTTNQTTRSEELKEDSVVCSFPLAITFVAFIKECAWIQLSRLIKRLPLLFFACYIVVKLTKSMKML
jgi:hypothetical protein